MDNPANGVVNGLGFGEGLMATFVTNDPEPSCKKTSPEAVERPEGETGEAVGIGMREVNNSGVNERVEEGRGLVNATNYESVPNAVRVHEQTGNASACLATYT